MSYWNNWFESLTLEKNLHPSYFHFSPRFSVVTNCRTFYGYIFWDIKFWGGHSREDQEKSLKVTEILDNWNISMGIRYYVSGAYTKTIKNPWNPFSLCLAPMNLPKNHWKKNTVSSTKVHPWDLEFAMSPDQGAQWSREGLFFVVALLLGENRV